MNSETFVKKTKSISPSLKQIEEFGLEGVHAELMFNAYNIDSINNNFESKDSIINLIKNYKVGKIPLYGFTFKDYGEDDEQYWIGQFEVYKIGISKKDRSINAFDMSDDNSFFCRCANNSESFLDALYLIYDFVSKRINGLALRNEESLKLYKTLCTKAAGGENNFHFFNLLIR